MAVEYARWMSARALPRSLAVVFAAGVLLVGLAVSHSLWLRADHGTAGALLDFVLLAGPAAGVLGIGYRARAADVDEATLPRLAAWTVGSSLGLLAIAWMILFALGASRGDHDAWFVYNMGLSLGAFNGAVVGYLDARSVSRAREMAFTREQRDRLEYLNHLLRHDLLNALNVIDGSIELLSTEVDPAHRDRLETIRRQSAKANELIRNVRILATATTGERPLEPVDLSATIEAELASLRDANPAATLEADIPTGVSVLADDLLGSVFENVIRNAIQHNDAAEPRVSVGVETRDGSVHVTVTDDGPGIPAEELEDLFAPSRSGDHGFGLYLVRTLVEHYGGHVAIDETGPDGTTIRIVLQRA